MSIDERFLIAMAITAAMAFGCRVGGLLIGTYLRNGPRLRRFLDILPTCAIGAVLGPSLGAMTAPQAVALLVAAAVFGLTSRFLLALTLGVGLLLSGRWLPPPGL